MSSVKTRLRTTRSVLLPVVIVWGTVPVFGQGVPASVPTQGQEDTPTVVDDVVVVTASRREERLVNAPATMTVISEEAIGNAPIQSVTDLLKSVPGVNTVQTSARDVNITVRAATGTLADGTLVLLDGRTVYQDFFGFVLWDFLPIDTTEIKQIEVIRGPASAVWGANAMTGVINVITKAPREMTGTNVSVRFGQFDRSRDGDTFEGGGLFSINATHAEAPSDRFSYKVSAGIQAQEPFLRPVGTVPGTSVAYPPFENRGLGQTRLDARADYETPAKKEKLILAGGITSTEGIIHSGLGPLHILRGSTFKYGRLSFTRDTLKVQAFVNALDAEAPMLLLQGPEGRPIQSSFENQVYDVELSHLRVIGTRHLLSYGGNYRHNSFDLSLAPHGDSRDEGGIYVQDEIFLSPRYQWIVGSRIDLFDVLDQAVVSPRTAFLVKPRVNQTIRFSINRAFQAPSFMNSFLDFEFVVPGLAASGQAPPSVAVGNRDLDPESLTAIEVGYIGAFGPTRLGAAVYVTRTTDMIQFTPLDATRFTYRNFDRVRDRGLELSIDRRLTSAVAVFANYSWQDDPQPTGFAASQLNRPPSHRVNAGVSYSHGRYFGSLSGHYVDAAYWQDIDVGYVGTTEAYTTIDVGAGVRSADGSMTIAVRAKNLFNESIQEHVFGDVIKRTITGEVSLRF